MKPEIQPAPNPSANPAPTANDNAPSSVEANPKPAHLHPFGRPEITWANHHVSANPLSGPEIRHSFNPPADTPAKPDPVTGAGGAQDKGKAPAESSQQQGQKTPPKPAPRATLEMPGPLGMRVRRDVSDAVWEEHVRKGMTAYRKDHPAPKPQGPSQAFNSPARAKTRGSEIEPG